MSHYRRECPTCRAVEQCRCPGPRETEYRVCARCSAIGDAEQESLLGEPRGPRKHELKCWPGPFEGLWSGKKTHEGRASRVVGLGEEVPRKPSGSRWS